jgi:nicotinamidase-related amidase
MPVNTLDSKSALVVIDLQEGIVTHRTAHPAADIVKRASALADAFRRHGLPVVLVNVDESSQGSARPARRRRSSIYSRHFLFPEPTCADSSPLR